MPPQQARVDERPRKLLTIGLRGGKTVRLSMEDYVEAVLAGEAAGFHAEALKAMAVAARSYATANRARHAAQGWDFCDTSHCQNLRFDNAAARIRAAAADTEAQLLWYNGAPGQTFYHRHCGGVTEAAHELWPSIRAPYLQQQADTFCLTAGKAPWRVEAGRRRVEIVGRTASGRVSRLRVDGRSLPFDAVSAELRLTSAFFDVRDQNDRVVFEGYGAGHGVGMCQTGANERAKKGHTWRQILEFYYPGAKPGVTAQGLDWQRRGGERIELWSMQPALDGDTLATAERALREAESRVGWRYDGRPRLRVYPSVPAFRDATGEPGWVAASTRGSTVRIQPVSTLRSRGVLDSTLLHEMLHLVVERRARPGLPDWFREGLVLWLADPDRAPGGGPVSAGEIDRANSEAAVRRAYQAAQSHVKRLAGRYGRSAVLSWVERGLPPAAANAANVSQQPINSK
jgi:stage II sporulation protein D